MKGGLAAGGGLVAFGLPLLGKPAISLAANPTGRKLHGLSAFGELKYGPDYEKFDVASPDAPKGGEFAFQPSNWALNQNIATYDSLNSFVLKGTAPPRMEMCFETLMGGSLDEPDSIYGALAKNVEISPDRNIYRFELQPQARFHDGTPITAEDVVFSYMLLKQKGHPQLAIDLANMDAAVELDDGSVELRFNGKQSDRVILSVATTIPILSKAFYANIDFEDSSAITPLGSGPWKVGKFDFGIYIEYDRVADYWAKDMPFARGFDHFDTIRIDFFQERQAGFEAFKKGDVLWREEFTSKSWATAYDFPAVTRGAVVKREFPSELQASLQGWAVNTRRKKFADWRTRQAIGMLFDFEWTNKNLFYGAYTRSNSYFERSDFAATGLPSESELALLEPLRAQLPTGVFGGAVRQNETDGSGNDRRALRGANQLLQEAGWKNSGNGLVSDAGEKLDIEFLIREQVFERILGKFVQNLNAVGVAARIRLVDPSQFQQRLDNFDFDVCGVAFGFGATPTKEGVKQFFHSQSANQNGSRNYAGIADPALDSLIDQMESVKTRKELIIYMKAIDRVLRAGYFWIPNWYSANHRVAMWDMFGWKEPKPDYGFPVERMWWIDKDKAAALK